MNLEFRILNLESITEFRIPKFIRNSCLKIRNSRRAGFTLLEVIISIGIFSVVVVAAIGITLSVKIAQEKTTNTQDVQDNVRYALEFMTKELRQGSLYEPQPAGCDVYTNPCTKMKFARTLSGGSFETVWYCWTGGTIYRVVSPFDLCDPATAIALTSSDVDVSSLTFYVAGNAPGPADGQPRVTIAISASSKDIKTQLQSSMKLQTTVTQRLRDGIAVPAPIGFWKLDDGVSSSIATDSSGKGNSGTLVNSPQWVTGQNGMALQFDGGTNYVSLPSNAAPIGANSPMTVAAWVNVAEFPAAGGFSYILGKGYDGTIEPFFFRLDTSGGGTKRFRFGSFNSSTGTHMASWNISGWSVGEWRHLTGVYNGTVWKIYFDGSEVETSSATTGPEENGLGVFAGAASISGVGISRFLNGTLDEVRIYDQALDQEQISYIMSAP